MSTEEFWKWFDRERTARRLSVRRIEKISGLGESSISWRFREEMPPTYNTCRAIATAFNIPLEQVLRRAGLLPHRPDEDPLAKELFFYFEQLDEDAQRHIIAAARGIAEAEAKYKTESEPPHETKKQH